MWEHHAWESPIRVGGRAFAERFLEAGWDVAWINGPLAPWNLVGGNAEIARRRDCWRQRGRQSWVGRGRLFTYAPLSLVPYRPYPPLSRGWFHRHSLDWTLPSLLRVLSAQDFPSVDLLWLATGSPFLPLLDRVRHGASLYRLSDDTAAFPDTPGTYRALEEEALARVDCVIATAASLAQRASKFCSRVLLLPNGVDASRFTRHGSVSGTAATSARRPRAVYVGALDSWFDRGKVKALSRAFPEIEILLAGPLRMETDWAQPFSNVRLPGPVPPENVPELLAQCDVGIIPFLDSPLTRAIHPVKLYEYFAAGLPVVASDLEEIRRIGSPALLARTESEWIDALRRALTGGRRDEHVAFAVQHDWSVRFADLMAFLGWADREAPPIARMQAP